MGNVQPKSSKLVESEAVAGLSFLEDGIVLRKKGGKCFKLTIFFRFSGDFAKIYKGELMPGRQKVSIKVPRVPDQIRKDRSETYYYYYFKKTKFIFTLQKASSFTWRR